MDSLSITTATTASADADLSVQSQGVIIMAFKHKFTMDLSEKVALPGGKKKHKKVGEATIPVPVLADFGIDAKQAVYDETNEKTGAVKGEPAFENGVPIYDDPKYDWLMNAILFRVSANSRNKFSKGQLKPGAQIPEDFDQLTAETARSGEALALRRDARASFEAYLGKLNKKQATVQMLGELFFNSAKVLASAGDKYVEALSKYVGDWIDTLDDQQKARFTPKIAELQESIQNAQGADDLDDL
jgi:hypothetical protein